MRWVKFIPSHVSFIVKSNGENCITRAQQQPRWATVAAIDVGRKEGPGLLCGLGPFRIVSLLVLTVSLKADQAVGGHDVDSMHVVWM